MDLSKLKIFKVNSPALVLLYYFKSHIRRKYHRNVAGFAAFNNSGKVLLIKDRLGRWKLPSGGIAAGEGSLEAAKREFMEETGHCIKKVVGLVSITEFDRYPRTYFSFIYKGQCTETEVRYFRDTDEAVELKFFSKKEVQTMKVPIIRSERFKTIILKSFIFSKGDSPIIFSR